MSSRMAGSTGDRFEAIIVNEVQFWKALATMRRSGGVAGQAAEQAHAIIGRFSAGGGGAEAFGQRTRHGESRIPHCVKFDLASGFRLVCVLDDNTVQFLYAGTHADCERWLERHKGYRLTVDKKTKRLVPIYPVNLGEPIPPRKTLPGLNPEERLLDRLDVQHFEMLPALRPAEVLSLSRLTVVSSDDEIVDVILGVAAEDSRNLLLGVLLELRDNKIENAKAHLRHYASMATPIDEAPDLLADALVSEVNSDTVIRLRELSREEFDHLFGQAEFQEWLLFLHPDQKPVAYAHLPHTVLLRGVSGSGKTCVLVHRAKFLAEKYPGERILVVTLNPALSELLDDLVTALCPPSLRARIDVSSIADVCGRIIGTHREDGPPSHARPEGMLESQDWVSVFKETGQLALLEPILTSLITTYDIEAGRYIADEFTWIRSAFARGRAEGTRLPERTAYLAAPRKGRSIPFSRDWRERMLKGLALYEGHVTSGASNDSAGLALRAHEQLGRAARGWSAALTYRAVLVDEMQDLGNVELEIIRALAPPTENGLFLAGDQRQQVLPKDHSLVATGIEVQQRKYFRKNFRNARQILEAGVALIQKFGPTGPLDEELEPLDPDYSVRESAKPLVVSARSAEEELEFVARFIELKRKLDNHPICVVACGLRDNDEPALEHLCAQYREHGLDLAPLKRDSRMHPGATVLSALETVKGFEFSLVLVTQCESRFIPARSLPPDEAWRDATRLYVAFTRARDELIMTYVGTPSKFLDGIAPHVQHTTVVEQGFGVDAKPPVPEPDRPFSEPEERKSVPSRNQELQTELARLKAENEALKNKQVAASLRVSPKGAVSLYGLGRFPVTLYKDQWLTLLDLKGDLQKFIEENKHRLKTKT